MVMALLTEIALAKTLNLSKLTIRRWRRREKIPFIRIGHRYYYRLDAVVQWIKEKETKSQSHIYDI